jgi:hypothetical protein
MSAYGDTIARKDMTLEVDKKYTNKKLFASLIFEN